MRHLPYIWYPLFTCTAIAAFALMVVSGLPTAFAAYLPVIAVGFAIVLLEWRFPEHREWRPRAADVRADAAFMTLVMVALPRVLAAGAVITLAAWMHDHAPSTLWPHQWPLAAQTLLMLLTIDFVRYWLHRACHRYSLLWRLHEVHHSPDILYVLNVARFHPLEKALHFCLDTVPFLVLGVAPELVACYFLLYSVNGLFQHSNVRLRYGWLNYIVGSAETHRWHHARDPKTAACNFGNTTIVWDLVFGTWYLPARSSSEDIGIMNRAYPKDFLSQMYAPFRSMAPPLRSRKRFSFASELIKLRLRLAGFTAGIRTRALTKDPMRAQHAVLGRIVSANRGTTFGVQYGFDCIRTVEQFVQQVPVSEYENLRLLIEAEIDHGESALTVEPPACYARTSGTTGRPKNVPLTRTHLRALRRIQQASVAFQHRTCPEAFEGSILAIVSPASEGVMPNGKPYGSASGMVAGSTPALVRDRFVLPASVLTIGDSRLKYLTILRLGIADPDVTYLGSANPTTLLTLIRLYRECESVLLEDLRNGTFFCEDKLPSHVTDAIRTRLSPQPLRANALAQLRADRRELRLCDLWPGLRLVVTWTCASAGIAVDSLRRELTAHTRILELGYLSSEFRGTITLGRRAASGLPTIDSHFFEFAEREAWDRGERVCVTLDCVRKGIDYYVIVTTPSGLYRYFINDVVRVTGFLHRTPLLKFCQKGKGVTNITGEKLYEAQVLRAAHDIMSDAGCVARFVMMLADEAACGYRFYVECDAGAGPDAATLSSAMDRALCELNIEYSAKRESGRLAPLMACRVSTGTGEAYKQWCIERGQREGQFKTVAIAYRREFGFDLEARAERDA